MKTVDITTEYNQQLIYVATYEYWDVNTTNDLLGNGLGQAGTVNVTTTKIIEPINKYQ